MHCAGVMVCGSQAKSLVGTVEWLRGGVGCPGGSERHCLLSEWCMHWFTVFGVWQQTAGGKAGRQRTTRGGRLQERDVMRESYVHPGWPHGPECQACGCSRKHDVDPWGLASLLPVAGAAQAGQGCLTRDWCSFSWCMQRVLPRPRQGGLALSMI
jgi:hypothetical protein